MTTQMTEQQKEKYLLMIDNRLKSLSQSIIVLPHQANGLKKMYSSLVAERDRVIHS